MNKYIKGLFKNLRNPAVSFFTIIDDESIVSKKAMIYSFTKIFQSSIEDYSYIGRNSQVIYANIGKFCSIAGECNIGMATHTLEKISTSPIFTEQINATGHIWCNKNSNLVNPFKKVNIGNDVWIGSRVMIMGGVTVGDGAVIGAGSIVTKDVPPYAIVAGVPAKIIKYRFSEEIINDLLKIKWWNLPENVLKENLDLFQSNNIDTRSLNMISEKFDSFY